MQDWPVAVQEERIHTDVQTSVPSSVSNLAAAPDFVTVGIFLYVKRHVW